MREIKVQIDKGKKEIKDKIEKGNKSPNKNWKK